MWLCFLPKMLISFFPFLSLFYNLNIKKKIKRKSKILINFLVYHSENWIWIKVLESVFFGAGQLTVITILVFATSLNCWQNN